MNDKEKEEEPGNIHGTRFILPFRRDKQGLVNVDDCTQVSTFKMRKALRRLKLRSAGEAAWRGQEIDFYQVSNREQCQNQVRHDEPLINCIETVKESADNERELRGG